MSDINIYKHYLIGNNEDLTQLSIISYGFNSDLLPIKHLPLSYYPIYNNLHINYFYIKNNFSEVIHNFVNILNQVINYCIIIYTKYKI